jgi:FixJ family two-component response regulator
VTSSIWRVSVGEPRPQPRWSSETRDELEKLTDPALICIIDDDQAVREATESLIRSFGFRTELFGSAEEFLRWEGRESTGCLILDLRLPGMTGLELQRILAASGDRVPVVFITAHGDEQAQSEALAAGAVDFLRKPFSENALLDAVRTALESS